MFLIASLVQTRGEGARFLSRVPPRLAADSKIRRKVKVWPKGRVKRFPDFNFNLTQKEYFLLQYVQETCCVATIHLNMMELEWYWQRCLKHPLPILAPHHHRIAELISILVDDAVEFRLYHGRCADNHVLVEEGTFTFIRCLRCQRQVVAIELL